MYKTVFEINKLFPIIYFIPFILLIINIFHIIYVLKKNRINELILPIFFFLIILFFSFETIGTIVYEFNNIRKPYELNNCEFIEGYVNDLHLVKDSDAHENDSFYINNIFFEYGNIGLASVYNKRACDGGAIVRNGMKVRITYIEFEKINVILKLDLFITEK